MLNKSTAPTVNMTGSTSSLADFMNAETKAIEWNLKLGNMKQVGEFLKGVKEKWEAAYQMRMPVEVVPETYAGMNFFDD